MKNEGTDGLTMFFALIFGAMMAVAFVASYVATGIIDGAKLVWQHWKKHKELQKQPQQSQQPLAELMPAAENSPMAVFNQVSQGIVTASTVVAQADQQVENAKSFESKYVVADHVTSIVFNESFSASVMFYKDLGIVKRKLRATSKAAVAVMQETWSKERFEMPDLDITGLSNDDIYLDSERVGVDLIKRLLKQKHAVEAPQPTHLKIGNEKVTDTISEAAVERALAILRKDMVSMTAVAAQGATQATPVTPVIVEPQTRYSDDQRPAGRAQTNRQKLSSVEGRVVDFGMRNMRFGADNGSTFEVVLLTRSGEHVSLRGVRLQELFKEHQVHEGDIVKIDSLGKTSVSDGSGDLRKRNEYQIHILARAHAMEEG